MKHWLLASLGLCCSLVVYAGGFQVALQGQKQIGMAHIGTPFKLDASSIYFNPGALPMMDKKLSVNVGFSPIFSNVAFQNAEMAYNDNTNNPTGTPFMAYFNYNLKERISLGLGVYTPFGSSVVWNDDWLGRYLIQNIQLRSIFIQPTVGVKILDNLGIGAGFVFATGNVTINRKLPLPVGDESSTTQLSGAANGFGANIGVYWDIVEKVHLGVTYKSGVKMEAKDGDAKFENVPVALQSSFPATNNFSTTLNLPGSINVGVSWDVTEALTLALEGNYVQWSSYDSLIFDFKTNTPALEDSRNPRLYENTLAFRLGAQYKINDVWTPRLGVYYDPSPITSEYFAPETPNCDNIGLTAGLSVSPTEKLSIDVSFLYIIGLERTASYKPSNFSGTYKTSAVVPGIGLTYQF